MINHQMQWDKPHDYCLVSVIDGEGKILIDDKPYDIKKACISFLHQKIKQSHLKETLK